MQLAGAKRNGHRAWFKNLIEIVANKAINLISAIVGILQKIEFQLHTQIHFDESITMRSQLTERSTKSTAKKLSKASQEISDPGTAQRIHDPDIWVTIPDKNVYKMVQNKYYKYIINIQNKY